MSICSICLSECENGSSLPCGHMFHQDCLIPWLWKNANCPNCRFSERGESNEPPDLSMVIEQLMQESIRQRHVFQQNMRKSLRNESSTTLKRNANCYRNWKSKIQHTKKEVHVHEKLIKSHERNLKQKQNELYKNYLQDYKNNIKHHNDEIYEDLENGRKLRKKLQYEQKRCNHFKNKIINHED